MMTQKQTIVFDKQCWAVSPGLWGAKCCSGYRKTTHRDKFTASIAPRKMRGNSTIVIPEGIARSERAREHQRHFLFRLCFKFAYVSMHARCNIGHVEFYSNLTMAKERGDIFQHSTKRWTTAIRSCPKKESKM